MCRLALSSRIAARLSMILAVISGIAASSVAQDEGVVHLRSGSNCPPPTIEYGVPAYGADGVCPPWQPMPAPDSFVPPAPPQQMRPSAPPQMAPSAPSASRGPQAQAPLPPVNPLANLPQQADGGINLASGSALGERQQGKFHDMLSDFFGGSPTQPTILPGALVDQAIFFQQAPVWDCSTITGLCFRSCRQACS